MGDTIYLSGMASCHVCESGHLNVNQREMENCTELYLSLKSAKTYYFKTWNFYTFESYGKPFHELNCRVIRLALVDAARRQYIRISRRTSTVSVTHFESWRNVSRRRKKIMREGRRSVLFSNSFLNSKSIASGMSKNRSRDS